MQLDASETSEKDVFFDQLRSFDAGTMTDAVAIRKLFREILRRGILDALSEHRSYYKRIAVYLIREGHIKSNSKGNG